MVAVACVVIGIIISANLQVTAPTQAEAQTHSKPTDAQFAAYAVVENDKMYVPWDFFRSAYGYKANMEALPREGTPWTAYYQGGSAYSTAKAGVHGFIRDVALELAEYNIHVNAVAPGPIDTERGGPLLRKMNETVEYSPVHMTPMTRDEVVRMVNGGVARVKQFCADHVAKGDYFPGCPAQVR